eukprot:CAMPEP_0171667992 /NCGR_PEP_ID=MMETSP0990-20121206/49075_1 /TAXON_ID=483369 /ORGANISM="non described non described, Strain CCMP2098" /LENGTH=65 /DNA_ID=CAMNT_0012251899 /DNA_START=76 /DNA_END=270 /DNA_ORIENTATION=-
MSLAHACLEPGNAQNMGVSSPNWPDCLVFCCTAARVPTRLHMDFSWMHLTLHGSVRSNTLARLAS